MILKGERLPGPDSNQSNRIDASPIDLQLLGEASDGDHQEMMDLVRTAPTDLRQQLDALDACRLPPAACR